MRRKQKAVDKGAYSKEIRVLHYFLTVVQEESITRAANVLHITQPTLSRQLAQLEEEAALQPGGIQIYRIRQSTAEGCTRRHSMPHRHKMT